MWPDEFLLDLKIPRGVIFCLLLKCKHAPAKHLHSDWIVEHGLRTSRIAEVVRSRQRSERRPLAAWKNWVKAKT